LNTIENMYLDGIDIEIQTYFGNMAMSNPIPTKNVPVALNFYLTTPNFLLRRTTVFNNRGHWWLSVAAGD
jgi:hypothetical protein